MAGIVLVALHRSAEIDASYAAYDEHPLDEPDKWGVPWWWAAEIGRRQVVVLSRDAVIPRHQPALVAPCTTAIRGLPSDMGLEPGNDPVPRRCFVNLDSVKSMSVAVLVKRLQRLTDSRMRQIRTALAVAVDCAV
jgi:mRNA interferase MazF